MEMRRAERLAFPGFRLAGFRCLIDLSEAGKDPEIATSTAGFLGKKRTCNKLQAWSNAAISSQRGGPFTDKSHELSNFQLELSPELVTRGSGLRRSWLLACIQNVLYSAFPAAAYPSTRTGWPNPVPYERFAMNELSGDGPVRWHTSLAAGDGLGEKSKSGTDTPS